MSSAVTVLQPWPLKILVDYAVGSEPATPLPVRSILEAFALSPAPVVLIVLAALASFGLFALNSVLDIGLNWSRAKLGQRAVYDLAADLFHRLQRLSLLFHGRHTVGDSLSRLTGDSYCVYTISDILVSPWLQVLTLVLVGAVAWALDPALTAITLVVALVMGGVVVFLGPRLKGKARQRREAQSRLASFVHQTLTAIPVVQAFGTEDRNVQRFQHLATDAVFVSQREALAKSTFDLVNGLATTTGMAVVLYAGGQQVLSGTLSLGSLIVFLAYIRSMMGGFRSLLGTYGDLKSAEAGMDRVLEVLDSEKEVRDAPGAKPLPAGRPGGHGHVRLEHVTFGYEPGRPVLRDLTLEAHPGESVALVGPTGAGKSTLVSLIPRLFDPWEGRILFDGADIRHVKLASLRSQVSLVLQDPFLLPLTVAENIAYGRPGASREEVVQAAVAARADHFIRRLPQGYDTVIGERGATLSGGEKQRLAIARALLKDAPVLILDEPTSALDAQTEADLLEALERLKQGRTTFVIAHRLSTIRQADRIAVIENGKVTETGTHKTLLAAGGSYHRLHTQQFSSPTQEGV